MMKNEKNMKKLMAAKYGVALPDTDLERITGGLISDDTGVDGKSTKCPMCGSHNTEGLYANGNTLSMTCRCKDCGFCWLEPIYLGW